MDNLVFVLCSNSISKCLRASELTALVFVRLTFLLNLSLSLSTLTAYEALDDRSSYNYWQSNFECSNREDLNIKHGRTGYLLYWVWISFCISFMLYILVKCVPDRTCLVWMCSTERCAKFEVLTVALLKVRTSWNVYVRLKVQLDVHGVVCILCVSIFAVHVSGAIRTHHQEHKLQSTAIGMRYRYGM
jgi:hypothetical protein